MAVHGFLGAIALQTVQPFHFAELVALAKARQYVTVN